MLTSPHAGIFWIVLNSRESRPLLDYAKQSGKQEIRSIMLNSSHAGLCWIVLKSLESRPLLDCAKKSGKQTFVRLC